MRFKCVVLGISSFVLLSGIVLVGCNKPTVAPATTGTSSDPDAERKKPKIDEDAVWLANAKMTSAKKLIQIGIAMHNFAEAMQTFPSAGQLVGGKKQPGDFFMPYSWRVQILPYIEQYNLYDLVMKDFAANPQAQLPTAVRETIVELYAPQLFRPAKPDTKTHYRVFVGNGAAFEYSKGIPFKEFLSGDGLSNTILVVEADESVDWSKVDELAFDPKKPLPKLGIFPGGFHALMADGSVRWIPADTDEKIIKAMITRNGGESFEMPGTSANFGRISPDTLEIPEKEKPTKEKATEADRSKVKTEGTKQEAPKSPPKRDR